MSRPPILPEWATDALFSAGADPWSSTATKVEPSSGVKAKGQIPETGFASQYYNWLLNNGYEWFRHLQNGHRFHEEWLHATNVGAASSATYDDIWRVTTTANASVDRTTAGSDFVSAAPMGNPHSFQLAMDPGSVAGNNANITTHTLASAMGFVQSDADWMMEWTAGLTIIGANNATVVMGAGVGVQLASGSGDVVFAKASANTNWQVRSDAGPSDDTVDSGVPPVANTLQKFRIHYSATGAPGGLFVKFYIDDVLVHTTTNSSKIRQVAGEGFLPEFRINCSGAATVVMNIGDVKVDW